MSLSLANVLARRLRVTGSGLSGIAIAASVACVVSFGVTAPLDVGRDAGGSPDVNVGIPAAELAATHVTAEALSAPLVVPAGKPKVPSSVRVDRKSATSLKVWWSKVSGAKSYKVYRLVKGKWKVAKATASLSWVNKKLPKRKVQQYRVVACPQAKGKGACSGMSARVTATTYSKKDKKVNVGAVSMDFIPAGLGVYDEWGFDIILRPAAWGSAKRKSVVSNAVVVSSSDPSVVAAELVYMQRPVEGMVSGSDGSGRLYAKREGSARVTVTAHNGRSASFVVRVGDRSAPINPENQAAMRYFASLVQMHSGTISSLARYALSHDVGSGMVALDGHGQLVVVDGELRVPDSVRRDLWNVMATGSPYRTEIGYWGEGIEITIYLTGIPWGQLGAERMTLTYSPYDYRGGTPPKNHWEAHYQVDCPTDIYCPAPAR
jgi:hypothetical protein